MLLVGLVFAGTIALAEFVHWSRARRKRREVVSSWRAVEPAPAPALRGRVVALIVAVAVAWPALIAIRQVDRVLAAMHPPREQSYGASSLTDFGFHLPKAEHVGDALATWRDGSARHQPVGSATPFRSPSFVVHWYLRLDFLFIAAYVLLLVVALRLVRERLPALETLPGQPKDPKAVRRDWYRRLTAFALAFVFALGASDVVENLVSWHNASGLGRGGGAPSAGCVWVGWLASWAKVGLALLVLVPTAVALLEDWKGTDTSGRAVARTLQVVRGHVLVLAVFAAALVSPIASQQIADVIRRWPSDAWSAVLASLLTVWFALLLFLSARWQIAATAIDARSSRRNRDPGQSYPGERPPRPRLGIVLAIGVALVALGLVFEKTVGSGLGLAVPGVMVLLLTLVSWRMRGFPMPPRRMPGPQDLELAGTRAVPALLLALPPVFLGLAVVGSSIDEIVYANHGSFKCLVVAGLCLQALGWILYVVALRRPDPNLEVEGAEHLPVGATDPLSSARLHSQARIGLALGLNAIAAAGAVLWIWWKPFVLPDAIGLVGVFGLFAVCLTLLTHWASVLSNRVEPLEAFRVVQLARTPVVTLVVIWAVVAGLIAKPGYEAARVVKRDGARAWSLSDAWKRWKTTQPASKPGFATPVLFVVSSGGGIRAGYWTDIALRCILEGQPRFARGNGGQPSACRDVGGGDPTTARARLFVASGISGGSVGLVNYAAHVLDGEAAASEWPTTHWERDDGAPTFSWLLFVDVPSALVLRNGGSDRGEILERSWQKTWSTRGLEWGLRESWGRRTRRTPTPLLLLNGTRVQDGCRFVTSPLAALAIRPRAAAEPTDCRALEPFESNSSAYTPAADREAWTFATSQDIADFLCPGQDVRLSTAGLLSARFPVISDSGRLERDKDCDGDAVDREANVVDGGYFDTSGASPVVELIATLDALVAKESRSPGSCYLPVLLQLDNSYAGGAGATKGSRPWETLAPALTLKGARDARENNARQDAALLFSASHAFGSTWSGVDRYAHVYPRSHPGSSAPLGWTLSAATQDDLRNELLSKENKAEIDKARAWLKPDSVPCP